MSHKLKEFYANSHESLRKWLKKSLSAPILTQHKNLYLTEKDYREFKENFCSGCGKKRTNSREVYGETFCGSCADQMEPGYRALKIMGGWKMDIRKLFKK